MRNRLTLLAITTITTIAAVALAGCGGAGTTRTDAGAQDTASPTTATKSTPTSSETASPSSKPAEKPSQAPKPVPNSLDFTSTTVDGKPFSGASLAGKPTVLWFWAAWCPKCRGAAPDVKRAVDEFGGRVNLVGVAVKSDAGPIQDFIADYDLSGITHLADGSSTLWSKYRITYQDQYVVIDRNGKILHTGELSEQELTDRLTSLAG